MAPKIEAIVTRSVTKRGTNEDRNTERTGTVVEDVLNGPSVGPCDATVEATKDDCGCTRKLPAKLKGREHPVHPIGGLGHVFEREHCTIGNGEQAARCHGMNERQVATNDRTDRRTSAHDTQSLPRACRGRSLE